MVYWGLDVSPPYRLVRVVHHDKGGNKKLEQARLSQAKKTRPLKVVIALPDTAVLENHLSAFALQTLADLHDAYPFLKFHAIEKESDAFARALKATAYIARPCLGMLYIGPDKLWLSVFCEEKKIFFHAEKINTPLKSSQLIKRLKHRLIKLFYYHCKDTVFNVSQDLYVIGPGADKQLGKIPCLSPATLLSDDLLAYGASLWDKKTCHNLLSPSVRLAILEVKNKKNKCHFKAIFPAIRAAFLTALGIYGFLGLIFWLFLQGTQAFEKQMAHVFRAHPDVLKMSEKIKRYQYNTACLSYKLSHKKDAVRFLDILNKAIPNGVFLDSLLFDPSGFIITGEAQTQASLTAVVQTLKKNFGLYQVNLKAVTPSAPIPLYRLQFVLQAKPAPAKTGKNFIAKKTVFYKEDKHAL